MNYYPKVQSNPDFPKIEKEILAYWQEENIFERSLEANFDSKNFENRYSFYDGPPFANGLPHYGHLLTGYIKDIIPRYQTMIGKYVERRFGWDCHGLPAEMAAEKELNVSGRTAITQFGIDNFNKHCQKTVMKYTSEWQEYVTRQARWVDFHNSYKTMNLDYMESVIWAFKELYKKNYIYESKRVMPYSWACQTTLSNFETRMDNSYRQRSDKSVTVQFELQGVLPIENVDSCKILVWTTTPWTIPSNLALAVNPKMNYGAVIKNRNAIIIAEFALEKYLAKIGNSHESVEYLTGEKLVDLSYEPLYPYFSSHSNSFKILAADFVEEGQGTGVVSIAPGFGEEDQELCNKHQIETICPIDDAAKFTKEVSDYEGIFVLDANDLIIRHLKEKGSWVETEQYLHNYPHCWRTDTPLIYRAVSSWCVKVTDFRDRMVELNQEINWMPNHIKNGLFGKWLENAKDWSISRNRFWGTPIPVWKSDNPDYPRIDVYGSIAELEQDFGVKVTNLHRPFIDELTRPNPDDPTGKSTMRRVSDVFDCWFESGSMPYAQLHYPFENKEQFDNNFPGDFIVEYLAQTRGWFYTLLVLSTALFDKPPFKNALCHGVILDINGQKLSKRLNNYPDPLDIFEKYGSDALRFVMVSSVVVRGEELLIDKEGNMVKDVTRLVLKPIWNAYNFFTIYANIDQYQAKLVYSSSNNIDLYILTKLKLLAESFRNFMDNYDLINCCKLITDFFEVLNNWYIRRSRARFWASSLEQDKIEAYDTIYTVLVLTSQIMAPILPLLSEEIYLGLTNKGLKSEGKSVHLSKFPDVSQIFAHTQLSLTMDQVREVCSAALSIRNKQNLRSRLPLNSLTIVSANNQVFEEYSEIIKEEINVKNLFFSSDLEKYGKTKLNLNFSLIGKRLPHKVKDIITSNKNNNWRLDDNNSIIIADEVLTKEEASIFLESFSKDNVATLPDQHSLVILDLEITENLFNEGMARDLVRYIQQARKDQDLEIVQKISLHLNCSEELRNKLTDFLSYIEDQTLSKIFFVNDPQENMRFTEITIEKYDIAYHIA